MVLSDRTIKEEVAAGRLVFDPYDEELVQPSSVDMRVDRSFRVFNNSRYPYIDVRKPMGNLSSCTPASSCWARPWSGCACPTTWSHGSRGRARWAAWGS